MTSLADHAVKLGERRAFFPCWPRRKEPAIRDNLRLAAVDPVIIRRLWGDKDFNIGVATGRASGVWILDVDGPEGEQTLRALEATHAALPPTVEAITGNGRHLYWRWSDGVEIRNAQHRPDLVGLDWRGEGGFCVAPPSVHPSGRAYAWSVDSASTFALAPAWLIELVTERSHKPTRNGKAIAPTMPKDWEALMESAHEGSHRAAAVARLFGHLVRKFVDPAIALALAEMFDRERNKEPLGHDEVLRICRDIAEREADRRDAPP